MRLKLWGGEVYGSGGGGADGLGEWLIIDTFSSE